jgi:hypothetical protein
MLRVGRRLGWNAPVGSAQEQPIGIGYTQQKALVG